MSPAPSQSLDLIVDRPQVKHHISPLWPIEAASLRTLRRAGYDRRDPFAVLITMPGSHANDRTRHGFYNAGMSKPAANPGSDADILYGMDRALTLEETGLDSAFPLPGRTAERYGERSGIYLSVYEYPSSGRDSTFTSKHYVMARCSARREARGPVGSRVGIAAGDGPVRQRAHPHRHLGRAGLRVDGPYRGRGLHGRDPDDRGRQPGP